MPLTKEQKATAVDAITGQLEAAPMLYLTDFKGLTVEQANDVRRRFRESGVAYKVVKNTLLRRAMEGLGGYDDLYDYLKGPTAVAFSEEPAAPARVISRIVREIMSALPQPVSASTSNGKSVAEAMRRMSSHTSFSVVMARSGKPNEALATPAPDR